MIQETLMEGWLPKNWFFPLQSRTQKPLEVTNAPCKPDFFISPIDSPESLKPIAIFVMAGIS